MGLIEKSQDRKEMERQMKQAVLERELREEKEKEARKVLEMKKKKTIVKEDLPEIASETEEEEAAGYKAKAPTPLDIKITPNRAARIPITRKLSSQKAGKVEPNDKLKLKPPQA